MDGTKWKRNESGLNKTRIFYFKRGCEIILAPKTYLSIVNFNKMQILFTEEAEINLWGEAKSRYIEKY